MHTPVTDDVRVLGYQPLTAPGELKRRLPLSDAARRTVVEGRRAIERITARRDPRLMAIVGPCSIHDERSALDYAERLLALRAEVQDAFHVVMRVYFEKPRTTVGWKGWISDPNLDGSCDMSAGLFKARRLLIALAEMGLPTATELLEPIVPQYIADLISWSAIGARTTESQTHRQMASGLSMPVGFKNGTNGDCAAAVNALVAARAAQTFLGIDPQGRTSIVQTRGNTCGQIVLRGGRRPNYDPISIEEVRLRLIEKELPEAILVDCSHANSRKKHQGQAIVWRNVLEQVAQGSDAVVGLMLESHLEAGNQKFAGDVAALRYGVSITDECISWETTEELLRSGRELLKTRAPWRLRTEPADL